MQQGQKTVNPKFKHGHQPHSTRTCNHPHLSSFTKSAKAGSNKSSYKNKQSSPLTQVGSIPSVIFHISIKLYTEQEINKPLVTNNFSAWSSVEGDKRQVACRTVRFCANAHLGTKHIPPVKSG